MAKLADLCSIQRASVWLLIGVLTARVPLSLAMLCILASSARAAVTPIPVGPPGVVIPFDTYPGLADGWATAVWGGGSTSVTNGAQMDAVANTNDVRYIVTALGTDSTTTNSTTMFGSAAMPSSTSVYFRWNNGSADHFLESRANEGVAYNVLLGAFVNNSGSDRTSVVVSHDYALDLVSGAFIDEDPRASNGSQTPGQLAGFRVYYSLSGTPGSWTHIPEFDGTNGGLRNAKIQFASSWIVGGNLYFLWCDDNAINGSSGTSGVVEGPNALDNFSLDFGVCVAPAITNQPHSVTVENCTGTNLTAQAYGSEISYQWFHDGAAISNATNTVYPLQRVTQADAGSYFVRVTSGRCGNPTAVESAHVAVTVQDTSATVVSAFVRSDGTTIVLNISHRMDATTAQELDFYKMRALDGGSEPSIAGAVLSSDGTVLTLTLASPITAARSYELLISAGVLDCASNPLSPIGDDDNVHVALEVGPRISISFDGANVHLTWPDATMNLYQAIAPNAPPSDWILVPNQTAGSALINGVSSQPAEAARFYSLRR